tara:strand:- start:19 stop:1515 length:1497 start_codon:yes stop_codon:yes gene_type:complete
VRDGRIVELLPPDHDPSMIIEGVDLGERFVSPGLIDAHMHLQLAGESLLHVDLSTVCSPQEFMDVLADAHRKMEPGRWLLASGWSENRWDPPVLPDQSWLRGCEDRPVVCWRMDHHSAVVNEAVLRELELPDDGIIESQGGRVGRDDDGRPTGLLQEAAAWSYLIPCIPSLPESGLAEAITRARDACVASGLTGVRTMEYRRDIMRVHDELNAGASLRTSVVVLDRAMPLDLEWVRSAPASDCFRITGCKSFVDGTLGSRTARLLDPYADASSNHGVFTEHQLEGRLSEWMKAVSGHRLAPVMHAIGDAAVMACLDAIEANDQWHAATIEHAEVITPTVLERLGKHSGVMLSMQPLHRSDDATFAEAALGSDRSSSLSPFRSLQQQGAMLAFGSDWPIVTCDPVQGMAAAILAQDANGNDFHVGERLGAESALRGYTVDAANMAGLEGSGVLKQQSVADFVIWEDDPLECDWASACPSIRATYLGGCRVSGAEEEGVS